MYSVAAVHAGVGELQTSSVHVLRTSLTSVQALIIRRGQMRSSRRRRGWSLCGVRKKRRRRRRTIELWSRARSVNRAGRDPQLADYIAASSRRYCRRRRRSCERVG